MSAENVETLRTGYAVFNAGDYEGVLRYFHEEIEWIPYLGALQGSIYHGHEELLAMWNDIRESFGGEFEVVADEFVDCGEKVAVSVSAHAVGPGSGIVLDQSWAHLASLRTASWFGSSRSPPWRRRLRPPTVPPSEDLPTPPHIR